MYDFLITKRSDADKLHSSNTQRQPREQLFIAADETELNISLYLDQAIVENLQTNNPLQQLDQDNLQDCCLAMEGISHFLYVIWNATYDRPVTQLELELQAEVDKFISLLALLSRHEEIRFSNIAQLLFQQVDYADDLSTEEKQRYQFANSLAAHYCKRLQQNFIDRGRVAEMISELRRFYRMSQRNKLRRINLSSSHQRSQHYF